MEVRRLKGQTLQGTYVVSITIDGGRMRGVSIMGKACKTVKATCEWMNNIKSTRVVELVNALKLDMIRNGEYRGEICSTGQELTLS